MPSSRMKSRPQVYPKVSFHLIRAINFISAAIVSGILVFFCIQLRQDGFKLPWTLIVVSASETTPTGNEESPDTDRLFVV